MKVIFLDMDGVLNNKEFIEALPQVPLGDWGSSNKEWAEMVDPEKVALLNSLILATEAVVVISSAWRGSKSPRDMQEILESKGFVGEVIGATPHISFYSHKHRALEIKRWLKAHKDKVSKWVSLDDFNMREELDHFVLTSWITGLLPEHVADAMSHLNNGWENVCEAIVATAASELDECFTNLAAAGDDVPAMECELWEKAHVACYRAINMGTMGATGNLIDALIQLPEDMQNE